MKSIFTPCKEDAETSARTGVLTLPHGEVKTPAFMPVGTAGTVKALHHETVEAMGYNLILGNTYHLYLRPGMEVMESYGGLHNFSNWNHNILTDSGGFQVFSLSGLRKIREEGVRFQSHIDGSAHLFTPERVVDIQRTIGSDIQMVLDVCTPPEITHRKAKEAMDITHRWAKRAKNRWLEVRAEGYLGNLFGIVQGNFFKDLREESARAIGELDFPGIAIGGLSVGETPEVFQEFLHHTAGILPKDKPRYVMGIGTPEYILEAIAQGIDMFDCVFATRTARNGALFTSKGMVSMKKAKHALDHGPIEEGCPCRACRDYSRGYLRHLYKAGEILGPMLGSEHNLYFLHRLVLDARHAIEEGRFSQFSKNFLDTYKRGE